MDFENGQPEATSLGLRRSAAVLENLPFRENPPAPPLHPYRGIRLLLVFQNPFGFFLPEETRGCSAWGRILRVWRSASAVKTDRPMERNAGLLVWFRAFG